MKIDGYSKHTHSLTHIHDTRSLTGHPGCCSLQVTQTDIHYRSPSLAYTVGHPDWQTLQVIQSDIHCRSSRLTGHPEWHTLRVIQNVIHCRSSRMTYTAVHPGWQVIQAAIHCRSSRLTGHTGWYTLQVIQNDIHCRSSGLTHCRSSRLTGHPGWHTLQVIQADIHCRSSRLLFTVGHPGHLELTSLHRRLNWPGTVVWLLGVKLIEGFSGKSSARSVSEMRGIGLNGK